MKVKGSLVLVAGGLAGGAVAARAARRMRDATPVRRAITINKPRDEIEARWPDVNIEVDSVRFDIAPGGRGTEVHAERRRGSAAQLTDDLVRFKQLVETGDVVRSDSSPRGHSLAQHLLQRAASPLERERSR